MARYSHEDLVAIVRDAAADVLRCQPAALQGLSADRPLPLAMGFGRRELLQLAELLEEALGLVITGADLMRLMMPQASMASAARLCAELLLRQDCGWPAPASAPVTILGVLRHV